MTDARDGSSRTIRQFHFVAWPEGAEVPHQADHFIDLIGQVNSEDTQILAVSSRNQKNSINASRMIRAKGFVPL